MLLVAGCGGGGSTATVASLGGPGASRSGSARPYTVAQGDRDLIAFARCMRAHGVQMSDPFHVPGHTGLSIDLPVRDVATRFAYRACNGLIQPIIEAKQSGARSRGAADIPALTRYAECMRSHDIPMLDPNSMGADSLGNVPGITSNFGRYSPQFRQADAVCRRLLPPSIHDDGSGP
jgi:hypothetical protein